MSDAKAEAARIAAERKAEQQKINQRQFRQHVFAEAEREMFGPPVVSNPIGWATNG